MIPARDQIEAAYHVVQKHVHKTPVLRSSGIDELIGAKVFFKCENFQKMGAFKMRGAIYALNQLTDEQRNLGVLTHSSGNFAQALSLAAKKLGTRAYIVMPSNAPEVKMQAVASYGGEITLSESTLKSREETADKIVQETGATFIHPSNDTNVLLGQGTAAVELFDQCERLDYLFVPVGGGGLIAGTAIAARYFGNGCVVIGAEPSNADDAFRSLKSGAIEYNESADTIADGLRTHLGDKNFPIIAELISEIICVDEDEIVSAMRLIWERMKIIVEPSSAVPLAAVLKNVPRFKEKKLGIILSGGNLDLSNLPF